MCVCACVHVSTESCVHAARVLNNISHVTERVHKVNLVRHRQLRYLFQMIRPVTGRVVTPVPLSMVATAASATKASCLRTTKCPACVSAFLSMSIQIHRQQINKLMVSGTEVKYKEASWRRVGGDALTQFQCQRINK